MTDDKTPDEKESTATTPDVGEVSDSAASAFTDTLGRILQFRPRVPVSGTAPEPLRSLAEVIPELSAAAFNDHADDLKNCDMLAGILEGMLPHADGKTFLTVENRQEILETVASIKDINARRRVDLDQLTRAYRELKYVVTPAANVAIARIFIDKIRAAANKGSTDAVELLEMLDELPPEEPKV